ncbi:MAG: hypothetical protein A3G03_00185 [Candidatus Taylorbacteria bacterium RIFCSPLOWO2_12_FULL_44_15c]|uniref:Uncharacterized protein n=1 Tax=Candidatus Taylorbacteria bacterium RIFCSPLOWO2_12_FULL_44_15c TaxID=1802333 RepID=A0A1G2P476_9BACT|nr:MAG: hypothetical protein A3I97_01830 [Candidatus Taylorbacteria bacterium RIFCSPLOWO2_02_FULL_44_35]OHA43130.1 MAG: hypothetical protein A3G03_00185 [Candidatus Taylorbacteria bacterium RIFCSPLOWO2_12_FULL_44_15c]
MGKLVAEKLGAMKADGEEIQSIIESSDHPLWSDLVKHFSQKAGILVIVDRTTPFNPAEFIGSGWTIDEEDKRSLALTEVDFSKIRLETMLKKDEISINGEEKLKRLKKAGHICLNAKVFETLWNDKTLIPESWKKKTNDNTTYIFFDGTILRSPYGNRSVLSLDWSGGEWHWYYRWLDRAWYDYYPSAVCPQVSPQN